MNINIREYTTEDAVAASEIWYQLDDLLLSPGYTELRAVSVYITAPKHHTQQRVYTDVPSFDRWQQLVVCCTCDRGCDAYWQPGISGVGIPKAGCP